MFKALGAGDFFFFAEMSVNITAGFLNYTDIEKEIKGKKRKNYTDSNWQNRTMVRRKFLLGG